MGARRSGQSDIAPNHAFYDGGAKRLIVKSSRSVRFVNPAEIEWAESQGNYVLLHTTREQLLVRGTLKGLQATLPAQTFVRVHRSAIVNVHHIKELDTTPQQYVLTLDSGLRLKCSRSHARQLRWLVNVG